MSLFLLPATAAANRAAFGDASSAARWLAEQPQTNTEAMLAGLLAQIEAFNVCAVAPGERYATLEVLRPSVFAVCAEHRRRYEYRALPLLPAEQLAYCGVVRLWRASAVGYLHALNACLENDVALLPLAAEVAQRVLCALRFEQLNAYVAGQEPAADFWPLLHAVWASAEHLACTRQPVSDRLPKETLESTVTGQYGMALLMSLARPFSLSRGELSACLRWFVRWRELLSVENVADAPSRSPGCALDLASAQSPGAPAQRAGDARWLALHGVLRKIRQRLELLDRGQSPESLKLGDSLSSSECVALLKTLDYRLCHPLSGAAPLAAGEPVLVAVGIDNCHRQLGGAPTGEGAEPSGSSFASQLVVQQIAVFGHALREPDRSSERVGEIWRFRSPSAGQFEFTRAADSGEARVVLKGLLALRPGAGDELVLATVVALRVRGDGTLCVDARRQAGRPTPLLAELRDKRSGRTSRHPAILLTASSGIGAPQLFIAAGLPSRALAIRFYDLDGQLLPDLRLDACLDRGSDNERWSVAV